MFPCNASPQTKVDNNCMAGAAGVVQPLQEIAPAAVLVDFIENPESAAGQFSGQDPGTMLGAVPDLD
jgi:hypothetical protein